MVTCMGELYIWTLKNITNVPDNVIGCHTYHEKTEPGSGPEHSYQEEKKQYIESRDQLWTPKNKRPEKLKDSLKEIEDFMVQHRCIHCRWRSRHVFQLILSNACIITCIMNYHSCDIEKILVDKSLVGKLSCDTLSSAVLTEQFFAATYAEKSRIDYVYFCKRPPLNEAMKRLDKLSTWEPRVVPFDIPGPLGRRLERKISTNCRKDLILVWWSTSSDEAWPWSPITSDKERANVIVLTMSGPHIDILTYMKTDCDPLMVEFSISHPTRIYTVEQSKMVSSGEITVHISVFEILKGKLQRSTVTSIPLKSQVTCQKWNPNEDKLVLGCEDGSVVLFDENRRLTQITRSSLVPAQVAWHPNGTIFFLTSSRGDIQIFDMALAPLKAQLVSEESISLKVLQISKYFRHPPALQDLQWCPYEPQSSNYSSHYSDALFMTMEKGPPVVFQLHLGAVSKERFSTLELTREYIKHRQLDEEIHIWGIDDKIITEACSQKVADFSYYFILSVDIGLTHLTAVNLLTGMNWDLDGQSCYSCLNAIVNHLLRMTLNADREAQLEAALGSFYAPKRSLSEEIILEYRDPISRLARRFFHHLLRYARFDKAFLLAVDIGARDLFMDLHYMALDKGETALAEVSKRKAEQIDTETLDSFDAFEDDYSDDAFSGAANRNFAHQDTSGIPRPEIPTPLQHPWQQDRFRHLPSQDVTDILQDGIQHPDTEEKPQSENTRRVRWGHQREEPSLSDNIEVSLPPELISDYTAALMDEPFQTTHGEKTGNGEEKHNTVKVIHFGVI